MANRRKRHALLHMACSQVTNLLPPYILTRAFLVAEFPTDPETAQHMAVFIRALPLEWDTLAQDIAARLEELQEPWEPEPEPQEPMNRVFRILGRTQVATWPVTIMVGPLLYYELAVPVLNPYTAEAA